MMMTLLRLVAGTALVLISEGVCFAQHYTQTNLVSNVPGVAPMTDPLLVNPWGLSRGSGSPWWVSDNTTGVSTLYNGPGAKQSLVVTIPPANPANTPTGSPTGTIFNGSQTDFLLAPGKPATFLFSTIDGTIAGWNPGVAGDPGTAPPSTHAVTVVKTTDGSSYTGLTSALIDGKVYLYAANFTRGRVDVYDSAFRRVRLSTKHGDRDSADGNDRHSFDDAFDDDRLPRGYVPFNVQAIGDDIVVTYVLHEAGSPFETDGPGLGFVNIYSSTGRLLRRLEHGTWLNAPWGVALAPLDFGRFSHALLIGQFAGGGDTPSSGFIAAYDLATGAFIGLVQDASGEPLAIKGLWALSPGNVKPANSDTAGGPGAQMYFTAVQKNGAQGLFGYFTPVPAELTAGNGQ